MKILVTGGAGFVGTNLISLLKKSNGNKIYSIDNYSIGSKDNHMTGVEYIDDDIQNIKSCKIDFDLIYHLAALSRIQPSFLNPNQVLASYFINDFFSFYETVQKKIIETYIINVDQL